MAASHTLVSGSRVAIRLPVGSTGDRIGAVFSIKPVTQTFGNAIHGWVSPAAYNQRRFNPGTRRTASDKICLVLVDTDYPPNDPVLISKVRFLRAKIVNEYLNSGGLRGSPQQGVDITVGQITSFL
jgi:hypothetical protein